MIELRVDLADGASVTNALRVLTIFADESAARAARGREVDTARQAADPKPEPKKEEPKAPEPKEEDLLGDEPSLPETPAATREDAAKAIVELSKKKGRAAAVAVLEKFRPEGNTAPEVKLPVVAKENYGKLVAEAAKALAA